MNRSFAILSGIFAVFLALSGCGGDDDCAEGSRNCACRTDMSCGGDDLACVEGVCRLCAGGACIPPEPKCYSPCRGSFVDKNGQYRVCSDEGLMPGCLAGSRCDQGSCVPDQPPASQPLSMSTLAQSLADGGVAADGAVTPPPAEPARAPGTCDEPVDCPQHQTCILGRCYSTCEADIECGGDAVCYRKVCRQTCGAEAACQGRQQTCQKVGNTLAVCMPQVSTDQALQQEQAATPPGEFSLQKDAECAATYSCEVRTLEFNTRRQEGAFVIGNRSDVPRVFTITKDSQTQVTVEGVRQIFRADKGENPLPWIEIGPEPMALRTPGVQVQVPARGRVKVLVKAARNAELPRWQGALLVSSPGLDSKPLALTYSERVPGRWSGQVYYFGNFGDNTPGQNQLEAWMANKGNPALAEQIPNAFMRAWANFRAGRVTLDEMQAVVQSVLSGSWDFPRVEELCKQNYPSAICAPYAGRGNRPVVPITLDPTTAPVPSGVVELGLAVNLGDGMAGACGANPFCFSGRIDSREALQYPANPAISIGFENDPTSCGVMGVAGCMSFISHLGAEVTVGARYQPSIGTATCRMGYADKDLPWLVPGFLRGPGGPASSLVECRDTMVPFVGDPVSNQDFAPANPIPDGRSRKRSLQIVDGILVEQKAMFVIFRETLESFLGTGGAFSSYGYMVLQREPTELTAADLTANAPPAVPQQPIPLEAACPESIIDKVFPTRGWSGLQDVAAQPDRDVLATVLVDGRTAGNTQPPVLDTNVEEAHYLCTWTELEGSLSAGQQPQSGVQVGSGTVTSTNARTVGRARIDAICPIYARVVYFTLKKPEAVPTTCNGNDSCDQVLRQWVNEKKVRLPVSERSSFAGADAELFNLTWGCTDASRTFCDDYNNLLTGKSFYRAVQAQVIYNPVRTEVKEAFRYKVQFQSRAGQSVGFAPVVCDDSSRLVPYCYAPDPILDVRDRVDCAMAVYENHVAGTAPLSGQVAEMLRDYLRENFGYVQLANPLGDPRIQDGFERLYSELLVMLGDDAYTASFASRFDLAGSRLAGFEGSRFEDGGINLSGVAGYEMYKLYQAAQYYQMVLDRFFAQTPRLWRNLENTDQALNGFITNKTVTGYLTRVIRASTQQSNTWSEVARRYQAFNRPDLARRVIERSYARSYMESQILAEFMRRVEEVVPGNQQAEVTVAVQDAQRRYRVAMLDMQTAFQKISDDRTIFGFPPDYIPFPALDEQDVNAFEVILERARQRAEVAEQDEFRALESNRSFETDAAAFQSELVKIRTNYDQQLGLLCGSFKGADGKIYPAIGRYAHLDRTLSSLLDPCGYQSGDIWKKAGDIGSLEIGLRRLRQEIENLRAQAADIITKVQTQCDITKRSADFQRAIQQRINEFQGHIDRMEKASENLGRILDYFGTAAGLASAGLDDNPIVVMGRFAVHNFYLAFGAGVLVAQAALDIAINEVQSDIRDLEVDKEYYAALAECEMFAADGTFELKQVQREVLLKNLDVLVALADVDTAVSELGQLNNERLRLESEWEDANQLTINVEAARNDPNVRIYKNDAIINADRSFTAAVREAYRATKVFEYYTSQSYAALEKLFLTRMITAGDQNLKQYLRELEDAFFEFEEQFGNPATRVAVLSLRDNVFQIPQYDEVMGGSKQLSQADRVARFRQMVTSDSLVDNAGNIVVPFHTEFGQLSPQTNNHKILFIEAEMLGENLGDDVARLYLRQVGSSAVVNARGDRRFYAFPPRTAVLNPFFGGADRSGRDAFDSFLGGPNMSIFRDYRFRDRPFVHTNWELVFNPRTEEVNKDIELASLDDVILYVYYTDFTNL